MAKKTQRQSWRDMIEIHPAADLFPFMSRTDHAGLQAMADSIAKHPQQVPDLLPVIHAELLNPDYSSFNQMKWKFSLLDGRNRLDAMELAGVRFVLRQDMTAQPSTPRWFLDVSCDGVVFSSPLEVETNDPWDYVRRANIERRMLDRTGKRELIRQLLKHAPEKSDRAIGKLAGGASKNTVAKVREEEEARGQIDHVETRIDTKNRRSPARKKTSKPKTSKTTSRRRPAAQESASPTAAANLLHRELMGFQQSFSDKFRAWVDTKPAAEGLNELHNALRLVTEELLQLAASINEVPAPAAAATALTVAPSGVIDSETGRLSMPERLEPKQSAKRGAQHAAADLGIPDFLKRQPATDEAAT